MTNPGPISIERTFSANVREVWDAITNKDKLDKWYFKIPDFELEEGATFNFYEFGPKKKYHHQCEILEIKPGELFRHTWTHPTHSEGQSTLTWHFIPRGTATTVRLVHEGAENFEEAGEEFSRANFEKGWNIVLGVSLAKFLENQ